MNHSERQVLALIDLASFRFASKARLQSPEGSRIQKIAGVAVAGRLHQAAGGLRAGGWSQSGLGLAPLDASSNRETFRRVERDDEVILESEREFPSLKYRFDRIAAEDGRERLELRSIELDQNLPERARQVMRIAFNPSIPDLRFGLPEAGAESRMVISMNGREGYQKGVVRVSDDEGDSSIRVDVISSKPSWASARPVTSFIRSNGQAAILESYVMGTGGKADTRSEARLGSPAAAAQVFESAEMVWRKIPHRVSSLVVRPPSVGGTDEPAKAALGGGTWANGQAASDFVQSRVAYRELRISEADAASGFGFVALRTPMFPLNRPGSEGRETYLAKGTHTVTLPAEDIPEGAVVVAWTNGFEIASGPLHLSTGITTRGFQVGVGSLIRKNGRVEIPVMVEHAYGGVLDRFQDLEGYSAFGRVHLVIGILPEGTEIEARQVEGRKLVKAALSLKKADPPAACGSAEEAAVPALLKSYRFAIENEGIGRGRYLRQLGLSARPDTEEDNYDNAGPISRRMNTRVEKELFEIPSLAWGRESCVIR